MSPSSTAETAELALPPRALAADIGSRADPRAVLADRVENLYGQMWLGILTTFAMGGLATIEFWEVRLRELVTFWWGLVLVTSGACAGLLYAYRRSPEKASESDAVS